VRSGSSGHEIANGKRRFDHCDSAGKGQKQIPWPWSTARLYNVEQGCVGDETEIPNELDGNAGMRFSMGSRKIKAASFRHGRSRGDAGRHRKAGPSSWRFLRAPAAHSDTPSMPTDARLFNKVGCALCHTAVGCRRGIVERGRLSNQTANLYSDLVVHITWGKGLADDMVHKGSGRTGRRSHARSGSMGQRASLPADGGTNDPAAGDLEAHRAAARKPKRRVIDGSIAKPAKLCPLVPQILNSALTFNYVRRARFRAVVCAQVRNPPPHPRAPAVLE